MQPSDSSSACMPIVRLLPSWAGPAFWPDADEVSQVPCKGRLHVRGVSDSARLLVRKPFAGRILLSGQQNGVSTSEFDPFIAVGTEITPRPPHRSERALLTHSVLTLSVGRGTAGPAMGAARAVTVGSAR